MNNAANATNATNATDEPYDEESRIFEAAVEEIRHQRQDACRLDGMRRNVQTTDKVWAMSLWDDDLVYGEDVRQSGACASAAYLLQKHVMAHSEGHAGHAKKPLCIMDTSGVRPDGAATAPQDPRFFTYRVTYNELSSFGTGRDRREAREMAALQMLRILYPGTWTYGQLYDALIPPFVPPCKQVALDPRKSRRLDRVERPEAPSWAYR